MKLKEIKIIGFDADDTLWVNEPYYKESEQVFCDLLQSYSSKEEITSKLLAIEIANLETYGFGTKAFILSMLETAIDVSKGAICSKEMERIILLGKKQINRNNELLDGVKEVLHQLSRKFQLIVATKGDLLDQERKLENSGLAHFFHHIEIMSDKKEKNYQKLFKHLDIKPDEFLMIGNSFKSDIYPVVNMGGQAIYVPFHTTWVYEESVSPPTNSNNYIEVKSIREVPKIIFESPKP